MKHDKDEFVNHHKKYCANITFLKSFTISNDDFHLYCTNELCHLRKDVFCNRSRLKQGLTNLERMHWLSNKYTSPIVYMLRN